MLIILDSLISSPASMPTGDIVSPDNPAVMVPSEKLNCDAENTLRIVCGLVTNSFMSVIFAASSELINVRLGLKIAKFTPITPPATAGISPIFN